MYNGVERNILNPLDLSDDDKRNIIGKQINLSEEELKHGKPIPYNEDKRLFKEIGLIYYTIEKKFGGHFNKDGYVQDGLKNENGIFHTVRRNRVIYELCKKCKIPENMHINHINEIRHDNSISNLNLMTPKENCNHGHRNQRISKPVVAYDKFTGEKVTEYPSARIAATELGISFQHISKSCLLKMPSAGGFIWRFAIDNIDKIDVSTIYERKPIKSKSHAA